MMLARWWRLPVKMLRDDFLNADMGISGGNFIIAETGSLALVMNEGNGRMCTTMPKVHIALVGIEKDYRFGGRLHHPDAGTCRAVEPDKI